MFLLNYLKYLLIVPITLASLWALLLFVDFVVSSPKNQKVQYGVTFSPFYAAQLGLEADEVYQSMLDDLGVKKLRIPVYWKEVERYPGSYDFSATDRLLDKAYTRKAGVMLVIGQKVPRWPECFPPTWTNDMPENEFQQAILSLLDKTVDHFQQRPGIDSWQIENEPLLDFGICRRMDSRFLKQEISLVRAKDLRPIIITDSGELSTWMETLRLSDKMGTTMYRTVWNPLLGYLTYPFPPLFYPLKQALVVNFLGNGAKEMFIAELQAEPWPSGKNLSKMSIADQLKIFPIEKFREAVNFGVRTGYTEQYLWGVEWWYYMKVHGHPEYWEYAKSLF